MKVHVWKRHIYYSGDDGTVYEAQCGREVLRIDGAMQPTLYRDLDKATCKNCLKHVRDIAHRRLEHYAPIASAATARLDSLRRMR